MVAESFWEYVKRGLVKLNGVTKQNFYLSLKESDFRFNRRDQNLYAKILQILRENPL